MIVLVVLESSKMVTFSLTDLEGANFRSLFSSRSRRELCSEAESKIHDQLLAEIDAEGEPLPTYSQATGSKHSGKSAHSG